MNTYFRFLIIVSMVLLSHWISLSAIGKSSDDSLRWEQLYDEADSLENEYESDNTILKLYSRKVNQTVQYASRIFGSQSKPYLKSILLLPNLYMIQGKIKAYFRIAEKATRLAPLVLKPSDVDYIDIYQDVLIYSQASLEEKLAIYTRLVAAAETFHNQERIGILLSFAEELTGASKYRVADSVLKELSAITSLDFYDFYRLQIAWGEYYQSQQRYPEAIFYFKSIADSITSLEKEDGRRMSSTSQLHKKLARLHFADYNFAAASSSWYRYLETYRMRNSYAEILEEQLEWPAIYNTTNQAGYYRSLVMRNNEISPNDFLSQYRKLEYMQEYYSMTDSTEQFNNVTKQLSKMQKKYVRRLKKQMVKSGTLWNWHLYKEEYAKAERGLKKQLSKINKKYSKQSFEYTHLLTEYAELLDLKKDTVKAIFVYNDVIGIYQKMYGTNSLPEAHAIHKLGHLYYYVDPQRAFDLFKQSYKLIEYLQADANSYSTHLELIDLIELGWQLGDSATFRKYVLKLLERWTDKFKENVVQFSEDQQEWLVQESRLGILGLRLDLVMPAVNKWFYADTVLLQTLYRAFINLYGCSLLTEVQALQYINDGHIEYSESGDRKQVYHSLLAIKSMLEKNSMANMATAEQNEINMNDSYFFYDLFEEIYQNRPMQYDILDYYIGAYKNMLVQQVKEWAAKYSDGDVHKFKEGTNLLWVSYPAGKDSLRYGVFVTSGGDSSIKYIDVASEKQLTAHMAKYYSAGNDRSVTIRSSKASSSVNKDLYKLLWEPLDSLIKKNDFVYNLPSGLINKVSFAALQDSNGIFLADKYDLRQLMIIEDKRHRYDERNLQLGTEIVLFGGINYDNNKVVIDTIETNQGRNLTGTTFTFLPGTLQEVTAIASTLEKPNLFVHTFTGDTATEAMFNAFPSDTSSRTILHIATHGFYIKDTSKITGKFQKNDPLSRTGFVLSGANNHLSGNTNNFNNGIITASKIYKKKHLKKAELIVLSACETALGDINTTQGVYGLQRAFRINGAERMIISLWSVPDAETAELMQLFYAKLVAGVGYRPAFTSAQQELRKRHSDPYKWAGFVFIGE